MSDIHSPTLLSSARIHWRAFVLAWFFPVVFLFGGLTADRVGYPTVFFFAVLPLFFWSFGRASGPWKKREITYWHGVFLGLVAPFLIWAIAVSLHVVISAH